MAEKCGTRRIGPRRLPTAGPILDLLRGPVKQKETCYGLWNTVLGMTCLRREVLLRWLGLPAA